jgi:hypothetical protein
VIRQVLLNSEIDQSGILAMNKSITAISLAALALLGCNSPTGGGTFVASTPQGPITTAPTGSTDVLQFDFLNDTTLGAVTEVYVAADSQTDWGPEMLSQQGGAIPVGSQVSMIINDGRDGCLYDVFYRQADDPTGSIQTGIDMCSGTAVVQGSSACSPDFCGKGRPTPFPG